MCCHTLTIFNQCFLLPCFFPPSPFFFLPSLTSSAETGEGEAAARPPLVAAPEVTARRTLTLSVFLIICECEKQLSLPRLSLIFHPPLHPVDKQVYGCRKATHEKTLIELPRLSVNSLCHAWLAIHTMRARPLSLSLFFCGRRVMCGNMERQERTSNPRRHFPQSSVF